MQPGGCLESEEAAVEKGERGGRAEGIGRTGRQGMRRRRRCRGRKAQGAVGRRGSWQAAGEQRAMSVKLGVVWFWRSVTV